jgi:hypothetical protein
MGPGLPGFGIASLFYIGAALVAPFHEIVMTARGQSSRRRWSTAITQFFIGAGMLGALILFYMGLAALIRSGVLPVNEGPATLARVPNWVFAAATLVIVLLVGSLAGAFASWRSPDDHPDEVAAGHRSGITQVVLDLRDVGLRQDPVRGSRRWYEVAWARDSDTVASHDSDLVASAVLASFPIEGQLPSAN